MKIAIVHERLDVVGGAEKVILALHALYPDAPIYTSFVDYDKLSPPFRKMDIRTTSMQKLPGFLKKRSDKLLPWYMLAFQEFNLDEYDVVLSSSYVAAKSVLTNSHTCHICYCYTPMRFAWDLYHEYIRGGRNPILKFGIRAMLHYFRLWDTQTSNNVDYFIGISEAVRQRIRKHYRRDAAVIYPPVQTSRFRPATQKEDYYLVISRLVPYKRVDLAVKAANLLGRRLVVIGSGRELKKLEAIAGPTVQMLGWQNDEVAAEHLSKAKALIFPGEEDFGIVPVEAQAAGTPVIAYGKGGATETVAGGQSGVFFREQTVESLAEAMREFERQEFDRDEIISNAYQFDESVFSQGIESFVKHCYAQFQQGQQLPGRYPFASEAASNGRNDETDRLPEKVRG